MSNPSVFLSNVYASATQKLQLEAINAYHHQPTPQNIDSMVEIEMKRLRGSYASEEDRYVQQMLVENPIIVERRNNASEPQLKGRESSQRSESCRKSRINNKIKKAKAKFRHQFISKKLSQSSQMLRYIQNVVSQAEFQLMNSGMNPIVLQRMRDTYGLDRLGVQLEDDAISTTDSMTMQQTYVNDKEF